MGASAKALAPEFLAKVQARDSSVIEALVRKHSQHLLNAAYGLGFDAGTAAELVQRVWCTFMERAPEFEGRSQIRTFLFGILYNKARELRRHEKRIDHPDPIDSFIEERFGGDGHWVKAPASPESFAIALQTTNHLQECLDQLPVTQRAAFWLREVEESSSDEICNALAISNTNLGVLLFRARNRLRECLEGKI